MDHPHFKLGKKAAVRDSRNLRFASLLRAAPKIPPAYDVDRAFGANPPPLPMFGNDQYGDCVMACRAHHTLRFEKLETNVYPAITTKEVTTEYFKETGNRDSGLVILNSIKLWRTNGWKAGGNLLKTKAFAEIGVSQTEVSAAIYSDIGVEVGINLPASAQAELNAGKPWAKTTGSGTQPGSWGGHCVLVTAYDANGLTCVTWGRKQSMTWAWFLKYCDEAYAVFDAANSAKSSIVVASRVEEFVSSLA